MDHIELAFLPSLPNRATPQPSSPQKAGSAPQYTRCRTFSAACGVVSVLKFAPGSAELLAWGAADGSVSIATLDAPPRLLHVLEGHQGRIADLDWSLDAAALLSCSCVGTACLWEVPSGRLLRVWRLGGTPLTCCALHPSNSNLLLLGTGAGQLLALHASTGRLVAKCELPTGPWAGVGASCMVATAPQQLVVADSRSCLHLLDAPLLHGSGLTRLAPLARFPPPSRRQHEPASLQSLPRCSLAGGPALLLVLSSGEVTLSRLRSAPWRLEVVREVRLAPASAKVQAFLCPSTARGQPDLLLAGGEDCASHVLDASQAAQRPRLLAALPARGAPVLSVAWGEGGRRLAAGDKRGAVVVWEAADSLPTPS